CARARLPERPYATSLTRRIVCTVSFFWYGSVDHRDLHSFPTRRSSDLRWEPRGCLRERHRAELHGPAGRSIWRRTRHRDCRHPRSEEHTSELQSPYDLVCRLLLEKKKQKPEREASTPRRTHLLPRTTRY